MLTIHVIGDVALKIIKLLLNITIIIIYRIGFNGGFLGVGGTWNLFEDRTPDVEIIASGVLIGYFIYNTVVLISYCFGAYEDNKTVMEIIMNFIGTFMFILVGGTALHYWIAYMQELIHHEDTNEKTVGIVLGILCIFEGLVYLVDLIFTVMNYLKQEFYYDD